ncbi:MAG TPA: hypothetical protein VFW71_03820 [Actinomycetota bacterium]|nr:hypothetical protein [Actinomycetota bacterium]
MPRRSRRLPPGVRRWGTEPVVVPLEEIAQRIAGPAGAIGEAGFEGRYVRGTKRYLCPYCQGWILPDAVHVVAFPAGLPEERRHYHSGCWAKVGRRGLPGG